MARVTTFSRQFQAQHPRAGEETQFVEKIWISLIACGLISMSKCCKLSRETGIGGLDMYSLRKCELEPKHHTILAGKGRKAGDVFSPRVWTGRPYATKQLTIAPDIEIVKLWDFEMIPAFWQQECGMQIDGVNIYGNEAIGRLAENDGLSMSDFINWICGSAVGDSKRKGFSGQIICWNPDINY